MQRYLTILIVLLLIAAAGAFGIGLLLRPGPASTPTPQGGGAPSEPSTGSQSVAQSQTAVQSAFRSAVTSYITDNLQLQQTVIAGNYALQVWSSDSMGGQALLRYNPLTNRWDFITANGGVWSTQGLIDQGVPTSTVQSLLANVPHD